MAGSVLLQYVVSLAYLLHQSPDQDEFWAGLLQWNATALVGYALVWLALDHRIQRPGAQRTPLIVQMSAAAVAITAIADDTGTAGDYITSDQTLTVSGTNGTLGAGEKVQVSNDGGTTWNDVTQDTGTTWSYVDGTTHS